MGVDARLPELVRPAVAAQPRLDATLTAIPYTRFPHLFTDGVAGIDERIDVPYSDDHRRRHRAATCCPTRMARPLVPYYFCSDEFVGNLTCQRFDSGADAFEQAQDLISRYKNFYLLNNFKRDRYTFHTSLAYKDRIAVALPRHAARAADLVRAVARRLHRHRGAAGRGQSGRRGRQLLLERGRLGQLHRRRQRGLRPARADHHAAGGGHLRQGATPTSSSDYPVDVLEEEQRRDHAGGCRPSATIIGLIDGKYIDTTWDFNGCGYYWADECQTRIGYFVDKTVALDVLSQSQAYFTGRDTSTDVRKYAIGYILPFKTQIQEKIGALLASDFTLDRARTSRNGHDRR